MLVLADPVLLCHWTTGQGPDSSELEGQLAAADFSTPERLQSLPLAERWIVSRLHQVS